MIEEDPFMVVLKPDNNLNNPGPTFSFKVLFVGVKILSLKLSCKLSILSFSSSVTINFFIKMLLYFNKYLVDQKKKIKLVFKTKKNEKK